MKHVDHIALITDWGEFNPSKNYAELYLRETFPRAQFHHVTHNVFPLFPPHSIYFSRKILYTFPGHTLILNLCDIYRNPKPELALITMDGFSIICMSHQAYTLYNEKVQNCNLYQINPIDSAMDLIHEIQQIIFKPSQENTSSLLPHYIPRMTRMGIDIQTVHVDAYENIVTNLTAENFVKEINGKEWYLNLYNIKVPFYTKGFQQAKDYEVFCYFNSARLLKIAKKGGLLASQFGIQLGTENFMYSKSISVKIEHDH